ncbi:MAG: hypothetical protein M3290_12365 [Actinomycetota bacterium]|nr:hypothetical protein [Actinomycetota bacterium]
MRRSIAFVAALIVMGACGSPTAQRGPSKISSDLIEAARATRSAGAARVVIHSVAQAGEATTPIRSAGFGEIDSANRRSHLTMDFGESPVLGSLGSAEIVGDGLVMYMKWPFMSSLIPGAKPWIKMDLDAIGDRMGIDMSSLMQLGGSNPGENVNYLWGARSVDDLGPANANGVATTHYKAIVDLRLAAAHAPSAIRDEVSSSVDRLVELLGQDTMPTEIWVDDRHLVRRLKMTIDFTHADESLHIPPMKMENTTDFVKYGIQTDITPPSPKRVTDLVELLDEADSSQ